MKSPKNILWKREKLSNSVGKISWDNVKPGDEGDILFTLDEHIDNKLCDLRLLRDHHEAAIERGAPIIKGGDTFCAMQGKWDPRRDQDQLRRELQGNNYLDKLVAFASEFYMGYARQIAFVSKGNHEVSILERHQTDLLTRLSDRLKAGNGGIGPEVLTYASFIRLVWAKSNDQRVGKTVLLYHGTGKGGPVTKGMIDFSRLVRQFDADVYVCGHIHQRNDDEDKTLYLSHNLNIAKKRKLFIRCSTYKLEEDNLDSWAIRTGHGPRPEGGYWLHWKLVSTKVGRAPKLDVVLTPIKT